MNWREYEKVISMDENDPLHKELAYRIIGVAMQVHRERGYGFMERAFENAMMVLMKHQGIKAVQQIPITVKYSKEKPDFERFVLQSKP
jgi:GxxExxY protein